MYCSVFSMKQHLNKNVLKSWWISFGSLGQCLDLLIQGKQKFLKNLPWYKKEKMSYIVYFPGVLEISYWEGTDSGECTHYSADRHPWQPMGDMFGNMKCRPEQMIWNCPSCTQRNTSHSDFSVTLLFFPTEHQDKNLILKSLRCLSEQGETWYLCQKSQALKLQATDLLHVTDAQSLGFI